MVRLSRAMMFRVIYRSPTGSEPDMRKEQKHDSAIFIKIIPDFALQKYALNERR
jgi:hypothetical protein